MNRETINIYCDESCHLQNDKASVMVLGTAYVVERKHRQKKLLKEYRDYINAKTVWF